MKQIWNTTFRKLRLLLISLLLMTGLLVEASVPVMASQTAGKTTTAAVTGKKKKKNKNKNNNRSNQKQNDQKQSDQDQNGKNKSADGNEDADELKIEEDGEYTSREEVAAYIHEFGCLPSNFITKNEAKKLGWVSSEGNLGKVAPGKSIGGDHFGNYEGLLPEKKGRSYTECDIDSDGGYRGSKRIIFSNDGLIYYTEDHYQTFELLYGEE